jgi:hypothetical protein
MSINFRLCPNDTTKWLQQTFQAIPLRVPEARIQPLILIARQEDNNVSVRGELKYLFKDDTTLDFQPRVDTVSNASLDRTKAVDINLGLKILEGFFQAFKMAPAVVGTAFKGVKHISFSFNNVKRRWIDLNHLGATIRNRPLDLEHPSIGIFKGEDATDMLLVSDALVSNSFSVNAEKGNDFNLDVGIPAINKAIADLNAKVKVKSDSKSSISFEGDEALTFAFSCVRLKFDPGTGAISLQETVSRGPGDDGGTIEHTLLDDDQHRVGMLSFD